MPPPPCVLPCLVANEVRRDGEQPGALVLQLTLPQRTHERLLRDFLGPVSVAKTARQIPDEVIVIRAEESLDVSHRIPRRAARERGEDPPAQELPLRRDGLEL